MAEDKKKQKSSDWNFDGLDIIEIIIFIIFLSAIFAKLYSFLNNLDFSRLLLNLTFYGFDLSRFLIVYDFFKNNSLALKIFGFSVAGFSAVGTFMLNKFADSIIAQEKSKLYPENMKDSALNTPPPINKNIEKWKQIVRLSESQNNSDWRLAIIEADIMLDELLNFLQLPGETMGEKLKAVEPSDFNTIEAAWEAHKFRNMIAHEGSDFLVNQREIRRIISLYESVLKEFSII